jgi:hypothetical protein
MEFKVSQLYIYLVERIRREIKEEEGACVQWSSDGDTTGMLFEFYDTIWYRLLP